MDRAGAVAAALVVVQGCFAIGCEPEELPPRGEALLVVHTDVPVPQLAAALRVDLYTQEGTWYESREAVLPSPADWPASFSLFSPEGERTVLVRLRAYPHGKVREYRGERLTQRPAPSADPLKLAEQPPITDEPRLVRDGLDITPADEPQPLLTVDRLLSIRLVPGERGRVAVVLRGECVGTMADLQGKSTCIDTDGKRSPVTETTVERDAMEVPSPWDIEPFAQEVPCTTAPRSRSRSDDGTELYDEEVCVPGGVFVLGTDAEAGLQAQPERVARMQPFFMDRYEVTVGRWREALSSGFIPPPGSWHDNVGMLSADPADATSCPYSSTQRERDNLAMTCVTWSAARSFCRYYGGDLPTEAQWEYAALAAGRPFKTIHPWGSEYPDCTRAVFGRASPSMATPCYDLGIGAQPVDAADRADGDRSVGLGIVNFAGGVAEWTLDAFADRRANCWMINGLDEPRCVRPELEKMTIRGMGCWEFSANAAERKGMYGHNYSSQTGFRCVRPGVAP